MVLAWSLQRSAPLSTQRGGPVCSGTMQLQLSEQTRRDLLKVSLNPKPRAGILKLPQRKQWHLPASLLVIAHHSHAVISSMLLRPVIITPRLRFGATLTPLTPQLPSGFEWHSGPCPCPAAQHLSPLGPRLSLPVPAVLESSRGELQPRLWLAVRQCRQDSQCMGQYRGSDQGLGQYSGSDQHLGQYRARGQGMERLAAVGLEDRWQGAS